MTNPIPPLEAVVEAVERGDGERAVDRAYAVAEAYRDRSDSVVAPRMQAARAIRARERLPLPIPDEYGNVDESLVEDRETVGEHARHEGAIGAARATFLGRAHAYEVADRDGEALREAAERLLELERRRSELRSAAEDLLESVDLPPELVLTDRPDAPRPVPVGERVERRYEVANVGRESTGAIEVTVDGDAATVTEEPTPLAAGERTEFALEVSPPREGLVLVPVTLDTDDGASTDVSVPVRGDNSASGRDDDFTSTVVGVGGVGLLGLAAHRYFRRDDTVEDS